MTTAQVVEKSVTVSNNSPIQDTTFTRTIILIMILTNVSRSFCHVYVPVELMLPAREATLVLTKFIFRWWMDGGLLVAEYQLSDGTV